VLKAELVGDGTVRLVLIAGVAAVALAAARHRKTPYDADFEREGKVYGIDPDLLRAIAQTESGMRPDVRGKNQNGTTDWGLMQINDSTADTLKIPRSDLLNPTVSIHAGAVWMDELRRELVPLFDPYRWVASYNAGAPKVKRLGIVNPDYVMRVFYHWQMFALGRLM
jgi:soluble lytic murein transglycosylase-like protein